MILELVRTPSGLAPISDDSVKAVSKIEMGYTVYLEYKPRRNYKFHKKLMAMLNLILNNQTEYKSVDNILTECKYDAGYYDIHITHNGEQRLIPKSISFATMDNEEFAEFYSSAVDTCLGLVPIGKEELEDAILRFS